MPIKEPRILDEFLSWRTLSYSSVLIIGEPGTGKSILCQQFMCEALRGGRFGIYMAFDQFPDVIRGTMWSLRSKDPDHEGQKPGDLIFIDCYSPLAGVESKDRYSENPQNLTGLGILLSRALDEGKGKNPVIAFDSLSTIFQKCDLKLSVEFLMSLVAKSRFYDATCIMKLNSKAFPPSLLATVTEMVDVVIETRTKETQMGIQKFIRIKKIGSTGHSTKWSRYGVDEELGLIYRELWAGWDTPPPSVVPL
jgi:KaiC/GvpD/RAD55 family RecA-like ATPase